jgi:glycine/serine hydroxymethyltransferase
MREGEMEAIGDWIADILDRIDDENVQKRVKKGVEELCERFPLYPQL